jgi:hypothetical protein
LPACASARRTCLARVGAAARAGISLEPAAFGDIGSECAVNHCAALKAHCARRIVVEILARTPARARSLALLGRLPP